VARVRDYLRGQLLTPKKASGGVSPNAATTPAWTSEPLDAPAGDLVILDFEATGNYVAIRPSGTEPKVKVYLFAYDPTSATTDLEAAKAAQAARLRALGDDVRTIVERVSQ
jgi:phosphomannomutase